ncbi:MAG: ABC transporter ATP-binding protein [Cyclobacteriaceae bacterium]
MSEFVLAANRLSKSYPSGDHQLTVLEDVSFTVTSGESISIIGPSGSGKTTLLGLCAGLDLPTSGTVSLMGLQLQAMNEDDRAYLRNQSVGFIFQNFQLLPTLTALENVMIPAELRKMSDIRKRAEALLERVGLRDRMDHYPTQLSGGEQQRVAVARAFVTDPSIVFADEPTGNLDEANAEQITELLFTMNRERSTTLVLVTHNLDLAKKTDRILEMKGGKVVTETRLNG